MSHTVVFLILFLSSFLNISLSSGFSVLVTSVYFACENPFNSFLNLQIDFSLPGLTFLCSWSRRSEPGLLQRTWLWVSSLAWVFKTLFGFSSPPSLSSVTQLQKLTFFSCCLKITAELLCLWARAFSCFLPDIIPFFTPMHILLSVPFLLNNFPNKERVRLF